MERLTSPAVERAVARLLGASADTAAAAVAALEAHDALRHGVLLVAVMGAARWGTDIAGALTRLAEGATVPANWSDYESRVAGQEATDEAQGALAALRRARAVDSGAAASAGDLDEAVQRVLDGATTLRVTAALSLGEAAFLDRLCGHLDVALDRAGAVSGDTDVRSSDAWLDLFG